MQMNAIFFMIQFLMVNDPEEILQTNINISYCPKRSRLLNL